MSVDAKFGARGTSVPELAKEDVRLAECVGIGEGCESMLIGILQEAWCCTLARASWRESAFGIGKDVYYILICALRVEDVEVREDLELECLTLFATCSALLLTTDEVNLVDVPDRRDEVMVVVN